MTDLENHARLIASLDAVRVGRLSDLAVPLEELAAYGLVLHVEGFPRLTMAGLERLRLGTRDTEVA